MSDGTLARLEATIAARLAAGDTEGSHVARLAAKGPLKLAEKLGEEAVETVIAAVAQEESALVAEAADLLFHLLLLLKTRGLGLADIEAELARREGVSGISEKAGRSR